MNNEALTILNSTLTILNSKLKNLYHEKTICTINSRFMRNRR